MRSWRHHVPARGQAALSGLILSVLIALTWRRAQVYRDAETLWRDTLDRNPDAFIASNNLGAALFARGELAKAEALFEEALRAKPDYAEGLDNLGMVKQREGKVDEAAARYREALRFDPNYPNSHNNLGTILAQKGDAMEALTHFDAAVRLRPSFGNAHQNRGLILESLGRTGEAVTAYRESLRYHTRSKAVARRVAWILATDSDPAVRNGGDAVLLARMGDEGDAQSLDVLAAAFAEAGRFDEAVRAGERALALAGPSAPAAAREGASMRLALYRAGRPFRRQAE